MMVILQHLFSLPVGPNVMDFLSLGDTLLYVQIEGVVLSAVRTEEGWEVDTLLLLPPGTRRMCRCGGLLYLAYFHRVVAYRGDSLTESFYLPFNISDILCRGDTLLLYDSHAVYLRPPETAPVVLYHTEDVIKAVFLRGDTLFLLQRNYLIRLTDTTDTLVHFKGMANLSYAHPIDGAFAILFGSGEVVLYLPPKGRRGPRTRLLFEGVGRMKVRPDTLLILAGDTLKAYRVKVGRWPWRR